MTIHWWHTERLVHDLAEDSVSENQSLWYALIGVAFYFEAMYYAMWFGGNRSWILLLEFAAVTVIGLIGVHECFKANGGAGGSHFLKRLFCLGVPVGIKVAIGSILIGQTLYIAFPHVFTQEHFRNPYFVYQLLSFAVAGLFTVIYYWRIAFHLAHVARLERSNHGVQATPANGRA